MKKTILSLFLMASAITYPCTGISLRTQNGDLVQGRTIEFGESNINGKIVISPRGREFKALTTEGKINGLKWKAKYGFVGASVVVDQFIGEGINEKGLNAGLFYFPHYGSLAEYEKSKANISIADMELVTWILSNFETVDEVKEEIKKIKVVNIGYDDKGKPLPTAHWRIGDVKGNNIVLEIVNNGIKVVNIGYDDKGKPLPTAHWRIGDVKGNNIVLEIVNNGEIKIYDNKVGVLTNSPDYEWHIKNLNNYINLYSGNANSFNVNGEELFEIKIYDNKVGVLTNSPDYEWHIKNLNNYINLYSGNANSFNVNGEELFSFGAGTGALGLPGDITPPSRFIRAFFYVNTIGEVENTKLAVNKAFHILNNFDIPIEIEFNFDIPIEIEFPKEYKGNIPKDVISATQWTAVSDLSNREFYYKTMDNSQIRKIDLKKIDFSSIKYQAFPMDKEKDNFLEINIK